MYRGIGHALLRIGKEEGPSGLYNGLGITLLVQVRPPLWPCPNPATLAPSPWPCPLALPPWSRPRGPPPGERCLALGSRTARLFPRV